MTWHAIKIKSWFLKTVYKAFCDSAFTAAPVSVVGIWLSHCLIQPHLFQHLEPAMRSHLQVSFMLAHLPYQANSWCILKVPAEMLFCAAMAPSQHCLSYAPDLWSWREGLCLSCSLLHLRYLAQCLARSTCYYLSAAWMNYYPNSLRIRWVVVQSRKVHMKEAFNLKDVIKLTILYLELILHISS